MLSQSGGCVAEHRVDVEAEENRASVEVSRDEFPIVVHKFGSEEHPIMLNIRSEMTIAEVKTLVHRVAGVVPGAQMLVFDETPLKEDCKSVADYTITPDAVLTLVQRFQDIIVTSSQDGCARIWTATNGECIHTLTGHLDDVTFALFSPGGALVLTVSRDTTARIWDSFSGDCKHVLAHEDAVKAAAFSPDASSVFSVSNDAEIKHWNASTGECTLRKNGLNAPNANNPKTVQTAQFSSDASVLLVASVCGLVKTWSMPLGKCTHTLRFWLQHVTFAAISRDASNVLLASRGERGNARVWDLESGVAEQFHGHNNAVNSMVYSSDESFVLTASCDNTAKIWRASDRSCVHTLSGHKHWLSSAVYSSDGFYVLTACQDCSARIWDATTGVCLRLLEGHTDIVACAFFSVSGGSVLTASWDHTAKVWSTSTGECIQTLLGHQSWLNWACYAVDGF